VHQGVDLVLTGAPVYTLDAARRRADAVAIGGGRIVAVGPAEEVRALGGRGARVVELDGGMVVPGFQDAHLHPISGGLMRARCDLREARTAAECVDVVRRYAEAHPEREWIVGDGWSMDSFPGGTPDRASLDAVVPDRPVYLENRDGHGAWVNARALELAGVTAATVDPADGRIERLPGGDPQGTLHEGAKELVERLLPQPSRQNLEQAILTAQAELHALGITAWQEASVEPETLPAYRAVAERGELTMRTEGNLRWTRERGEEQIADMVALRAEGSVGRLRIRGAKIFQDGVAENYTAALLDSYLGPDGRPTGNTGLGMHEPEELTRMVTLLDAEGFQVHIHAIGDRAVRESLDAVEAARRANGARDARHHLAHIQFVHPDDVPRFRELGVVANAQPYWACREGYVTDLTEPFVGPERSGWMYPFGSLRRAGAALAFGSDWTVSTPNPLEIMEVAIRRIQPGADAEPLLAAEAVDLPAALAAATVGSAYVNFLEGETGSLEVGKAADLAVLDRDLFALQDARVSEARVLLTLVEGETVFAVPGLA
jgi:predicted amidohydrolase YtcJ